MGSTESSEARRVSFGKDEEERVRVLQGIRLSDSVVNRMKDPSQPCKAEGPALPRAPPPSTRGTSEGPQKDSKPPKSEYGGGRQPSGVEEDFLKRYKQEQAKIQDELLQVVTREREAAAKHRSASMQRGEGSGDQEKQKSTQLARELESREAELSRRDTFYKEQLGRIDKKAPQDRACVLRAAGPDPSLLPRPPAGSASVLRPGQGLPALREGRPQGLRSPRSWPWQRLGAPQKGPVMGPQSADPWATAVFSGVPVETSVPGAALCLGEREYATVREQIKQTSLLSVNLEAGPLHRPLCSRTCAECGDAGPTRQAVPLGMPPAWQGTQRWKPPRKRPPRSRYELN
uniref:Coiled-coil-helix-coiled-coil-helix domain containing 6 n=1 Tax=Suricata suricatta TaxID=37032 RepID=A0A673UK83_SURSU